MTDTAQDARRGGGLGQLAKLKLLYGFAKPYRWLLAAALLALVSATAASLTLAYTLKPLIDHGFSGDRDNIDVYFLQLLVVAAVMALATAFRYYYVTVLGERVVADLRRTVHGRLLSLQPRFFDDNRPGELSTRLTADTGVIQTVLGSTLSMALRNALTFVGGMVMMIITNAQLMLTIVLVIPLVLVPILGLGRLVRRLSRKSQDRLADVGARATETYGAIRIVQAFRQEARERDRFGTAVAEAFAVAKQRILIRALMTGAIILLIFGAIAYILWRGALEVAAGDLTGGEMAAFVVYAVLVATSAGTVIELYGEIQRAAGASGRLRELLAMRSELSVPEAPVSLGEHKPRAVRFNRVRFGYDPGQTALDGIDLDISAGETVALVGPSGAGKTTLFHLLLRFDDPGAGEICIDGVPLTAMDPQHLRAQISLVPQDVLLFADSVLENVRYGRPDASDREVLDALKAAHALEFVEDLPQGMQTVLGERGARLSGGQRQRLAIARALLADAPILLLDEATAALDAQSERHVQDALGLLMRNRTSIVIAHRLSTVRDADRIVLMDKGRILDIGPHETLMGRNPLYQDMVRLQTLAERPMSAAE